MINDTCIGKVFSSFYLFFLSLIECKSVKYVTWNYVMVNSFDFVKEYLLEAKLPLTFTFALPVIRGTCRK